MAGMLRAGLIKQVLGFCRKGVGQSGARGKAGRGELVGRG